MILNDFQLIWTPIFVSLRTLQPTTKTILDIFEHITKRKPDTGLRRIDNIAMDLAINGLPELQGKLPCEKDPGPLMPSGEHLKGCLPGEGPFKDLPAGKSYEWYLQELERMQEEHEQEQGEQGQGGESQDGEGGEGGSSDPFGGADSLDDHDQFGEVDGTSEEIAKERLKETVRKAAEEASKSNGWGSVSSSVRKDVMKMLETKVDWRKVLRFFVKSSQRADRSSSIKRINRRYAYIHPGRKANRVAKLAVSIDQSGSVSDEMLSLFFAELNKLSAIAEFVVIPFDTQVDESLVYTWKKNKHQKPERVMMGGTDFNAPTDYVNKGGFDGHIILTDMCAPKPRPSKCQRMWMTTPEYAKANYFATNERVVIVE